MRSSVHVGVILLGALAPAAALAQAVPTKNSIIEQLDRKAKSRPGSINWDSVVNNSIEVVANPRAGSPKPSVAELTRDLPSMDFEILFDYNSSSISANSVPVLTQLGQALSDPRLATKRFIIGGHTDGAGTSDYNLRLSQQRAESVRMFLVTALKVPSERLLPMGFGMDKLKDADNPRSASNRRVEIINIGQ